MGARIRPSRAGAGGHDAMRLTTRLLLLIFFVAATIGLLSLLATRSVMLAALNHETEARGTIVAQALADRIAGPLIEGELIPVHEALHEAVARTPDLLFAYVIGFDGEIAAHTFEGGFPRALLSRPANGKEPRPYERLETSLGPVLEADQPVVPGLRAQVRVGLSEKPIEGRLRAVRNRVVGIVFLATLASLLAGVLLGRRIVEPLAKLSESMRAFGRDSAAEGELAPGGGGREVRELTAAFNRMIADRRDAEEALRRTEGQLRQSQKMEAIGQLAGGVAHDFNNLLTAITGYSEMLLADVPPADPHRRGLEEIRKAADRAAALTSQLLSFSRRQLLAPRVLDLNEVVTGMDPMLRRLIGEDIILESIPAPGLGKALADPHHLEQVLVNLVVNARDAMPAGGRLTIETANVDLDATYLSRQPHAKAGPHVMLAVSDTGCGIDPQALPHIFEPFFTTKEKGKGTGLGLATVFGIVSQSGGHVTAYSERGKGTSFKVYLPRIAETDAVPPDRTDGHPAPLHGSGTILLVEDEEAVRTLAAALLRRFGYDVLEGAGGPEALDLAAGHGGPIHLLVTDVVMPGMNGRQLAERLRASNPALRVLYMSGYTDNAIVHHGVIDRGVSFLQKPFTPESLARKVRETLDAPAPAQGE
jgi:signal transduction histidine kinase/CheY-like chemotaxis protein